MNRGEIWWADIDGPRASEPGYTRPVLIVQSDAYNRSHIKPVLAVVLTSNLVLAEAPGNVKLAARSTGLPKDSVADVSQIITIDKAFLRDRCGCLEGASLAQVEKGLRQVLDLT